MQAGWRSWQRRKQRKPPRPPPGGRRQGRRQTGSRQAHPPASRVATYSPGAKSRRLRGGPLGNRVGWEQRAVSQVVLLRPAWRRAQAVAPGAC